MGMKQIIFYDSKWLKKLSDCFLGFEKCSQLAVLKVLVFFSTLVWNKCSPNYTLYYLNRLYKVRNKAVTPGKYMMPPYQTFYKLSSKQNNVGNMPFELEKWYFVSKIVLT